MHFLHASTCPSPSKLPEHGRSVGIWDARLCRAGKRLLNKHPQQDRTQMKSCEPPGDMGRRTRGAGEPVWWTLLCSLDHAAPLVQGR